MSDKSWESVTPASFIELLDKHGLLYSNYLMHEELIELVDEDDDFESECLVHRGSVTSSEPVFVFPDAHVLVLGDVQVNTLNLNGEFVTIQVSGNVTCDHLNGGFDQMVVIGGNLNVNGIVNRDYRDAEFIVNGDVSAEFIGGNDVTCGGNATFQYGNARVVGLDYWDLPKADRISVSAEHGIDASSKYIGFDLTQAQDLRALLREKTRPRAHPTD